MKDIQVHREGRGHPDRCRLALESKSVGEGKGVRAANSGESRTASSRMDNDVSRPKNNNQVFARINRAPWAASRS